ncbi:peptidoglycan DD-metalloendopeptidase family protein [Oscillospiraceae bacterium PP1C4]
MSPKGKRIFAWVMAALMALMFVVPYLSFAAHADDGELVEEDSYSEESDYSDEKSQITDLNAKYKELQKKQNEIQQQINKAKGEKEKKIAIKQQIEGQIGATTEQIEILTQRISLLEDNISIKEKELAKKQGEINENFELFRKRMRAMYMAGGNASTLGLVLGAENYSQFLMRTEVVSRVAQHDQSLIDKLTKEKKELEAIKQEIQADKASVMDDKTEMDTKKQELDGQKAVAQKQIQDMAEMEKQFLANKDALQKQMKQVQATIDAIYAEINKNAANIPYVGGQMGWPAPSLAQVSSNFGYRFSGSDFHTGIDITGSGAYGASIVAANTGTVAFVNTAVTPGYGYGKYLIVDHGGGISTLYAHCSAITASVGQTVSRGEKIAEVGSTGWSTGPHVHFEVRLNGKAQNPVSYLSK